MQMAWEVRRWIRSLAATAVAAVLAGCATVVPAPKGAGFPALASVPSAPPSSGPVSVPAEPREAWARVLRRFVDSQGRIDFVGMAQDRQDLDAMVAWIYQVSPETHPTLFPTANHRLAYHLNAYNALAMYAVLEDGIPKTLAGLKKVFFFYFTSYEVGGRRFTLYSYENEVIRKLGDPRIHFAINCMSVGCPTLPQEPFDASQVQAQLERETRQFFASSKHLQVNHDKKEVRASEILKFFTEDFLAVSPSLVAYINRYIATPIPADYTVGFIPYDWTIHQQPRPQ